MISEIEKTRSPFPKRGGELCIQSTESTLLPAFQGRMFLLRIKTPFLVFFQNRERSFISEAKQNTLPLPGTERGSYAFKAQKAHFFLPCKVGCFC